MNILYVNHEFPPYPGGVGQYTAQMAAAFTAAGHKVVVFTGRGEDEPSEEHGACGTVLRAYRPEDVGTPAWIEQVRQLCHEHHIDWIEGADHGGECAPLLGLEDRPPIMIKVHACQVIDVLKRAQIHYRWQHLTWGIARWRARGQLQRERRVIEAADLEAVCSARLLQEMQAQGLRLPARTLVLPNPIQDPGEDDEPEWPDPTLLFVGRLEFLKGIQFLPAILEAASEHMPGVRLRIAGADTYARGIGSLRAWLEKRLGPWRDQVEFLGPLGADALDREYRKSWAVVVPSLWDNFPMVVLEAMIRGKAIATTPHGGMPEMLEGTGSLIAPPASREFRDGIVDVLKDDASRFERGRAVRQRALTEYVPDVIVSRYLNFMKEVL